MRLLLLLLSLAALAPAQTFRESIEWLDVWLPNTNDRALPRVLLIGDSITRGYYKPVESALAGKAYTARLTTSKSLGDPALLDQIALVLAEQSFDLIHFNNGMHGDLYSEDAYAAALPALLKTLRRLAPRARLVLATTTDVRQRDNLDTILPKTARMIRRNQLLAAFAQSESIPLNDLFSIAHNQPALHAADGVHFTEKGSAALAAQVAAALLPLLP